jgi:hypothetical protein
LSKNNSSQNILQGILCICNIKGKQAKDIDFIRHFCSDSLGVKIVIDEITRLGAKPKRGSGKHRLTRIKVCDSDLTMITFYFNIRSPTHFCSGQNSNFIIVEKQVHI